VLGRSSLGGTGVWGPAAGHGLDRMRAGSFAVPVFGDIAIGTVHVSENLETQLVAGASIYSRVAFITISLEEVNRRQFSGITQHSVA